MQIQHASSRPQLLLQQQPPQPEQQQPPAPRSAAVTAAALSRTTAAVQERQRAAAVPAPAEEGPGRQGQVPDLNLEARGKRGSRRPGRWCGHGRGLRAPPSPRLRRPGLTARIHFVCPCLGPCPCPFPDHDLSDPATLTSALLRPVLANDPARDHGHDRGRGRDHGRGHDRDLDRGRDGSRGPGSAPLRLPLAPREVAVAVVRAQGQG